MLLRSPRAVPGHVQPGHASPNTDGLHAMLTGKPYKDSLHAMLTTMPP